MDEKRRRRLAVVWVVFALLMGYAALAGGFEANLAEILQLVVALFGVGLAYLYYANPRDVLSFGSRE